MRNYSICIDMFALLYSKLSLNSSMVNRTTIDKYNEALERKLNEQGKEYFTVRTTSYDDPQLVFNTLKIRIMKNMQYFIQDIFMEKI